MRRCLSIRLDACTAPSSKPQISALWHGVRHSALSPACNTTDQTSTPLSVRRCMRLPAALAMSRCPESTSINCGRVVALDGDISEWAHIWAKMVVASMNGEEEELLGGRL